ncbi:MAG: universal stress protein [Terriglobales bacterium]
MASIAPQAALALRNILIATDFSLCSERAVLHAVAAAHRFGSTLHLVHVVRPEMFVYCPPEGYMGAVEAEQYASDLARKDMQNMMADVLHRTHCEDVKCVTHIEVGVAGEMLCAEIERQHIDLAVVGTHARTGLRRIVMGSVAEDVFRHASCPVLTVGPYSWRSDPQSVKLKHILFPTDLSDASARAVPFVKAMAAEFGAGLTVVHAMQTLGAGPASDRLRVVAALEQRMREMMNDGGSMIRGVEFLVEIGDVPGTVLDIANRAGADLIAFGLKAPHYYTDRLPWMHAYEIICQARCPVLSLRSA